jgi:N-acetylglutamate synthase
VTFSGEPENHIRFLEELSLTALPALQTAYYDGWILRFAGGHTRRANSVSPVYPSTLNPDDKIKHCENFYRAYHLPSVFKLTPMCYPSDLDQRLAFHSYKEYTGASVQECDLTPVDEGATDTITIQPEISEAWLAAYFRLNGNPEQHLAVMRQILTSMTPEKCCAALYRGTHMVAVGLGVLDLGYVGLFDIVTDAAYRRQGLGEQLVRGLLGWGKGNGAEHAYLQVRPDNDPALALYEKLGFSEVYQYWYRTKT